MNQMSSGMVTVTLGTVKIDYNVFKGKYDYGVKRAKTTKVKYVRVEEKQGINEKQI